MYTKPMELERKHLDSAISEILYKPLAIISAPSGYGKTTIAKSFFKNHPEIKSLWLTFGYGAVDEVWVWQKLCSLFKESIPELFHILTELGLPGSTQERAFFLGAVQEYIKSPICLVLDDYHECNGSTLNSLIEHTVYEEIPNLHIMIISRIYPDLACEEMFLKGYCTILDQKMMMLSREESEQVFTINDIQLSSIDAERMYQYTDGWIAAVYLALYDYKRTGHFEHLSNIGRLMKTAIFDKLSPVMQELFMKMSLFESFTLKEACYVLQKDIPSYALVQMQEQFGFIQYDTKTGVCIMHSLLRSVASDGLDRSGIDKSSLYLRCAEYQQSIGNYVGAITCYQNIHALEKIMQILSSEVRDIIFEQAPAIVTDIFRKIPLDTRLKYPRAYLGFIYYIAIKEDGAKGQKLYLEAKERYEQIAHNSTSLEQIKGELLIIDAFLQFNDLEKTNNTLKEASRLLGYHASSIFNHSLLSFGNPFITVLYYKESGALEQTIALEKQYAEYYTRLVQGVPGEWNDLFDAEYALMRNDLETASQLSLRVAEKASFTKETCIVVSGYYTHLRCLIQQGREKEFYHIMDCFENQMKGIVRPILNTDYELACGYLYACIGELEKIPDWLRSFELDSCSRVVRIVRSGCVVYGMNLCHMGKWVLLDTVADQMLIPYESTCHAYVVIFGHIYKAVAALQLHGLDTACRHLSKALSLAEPDDLKIPFVETAPFTMPILEALSKTSTFAAVLKPLAQKFIQGLKAFEKKTHSDSIFLTKREEELMRYVKGGLRNSEISEKMHIALVTVEKNLTSVYRKLGVTNRSAAIARINDHGLL